VRKTAFDGQANIQRHIQSNDQVDTGKMLNSVYVKTADESTYKGGENILPEVEAPPDNKTAYIGVGASYAIFQNYGTRFIPSRPFFEPGIEETRQGFEAAIARVESILGGQ
jgi:hypothetical protein